MKIIPFFALPSPVDRPEKINGRNRERTGLIMARHADFSVFTNWLRAAIGVDNRALRSNLDLPMTPNNSTIPQPPFAAQCGVVWVFLARAGAAADARA